METKFNLLNPSTWFPGDQALKATPEEILQGKKKQIGGTSGKLKQSTEFESSLEIQTFKNNVDLAEDMGSPTGGL